MAICTIEKANSLINKLIEEKSYFDIEFLIIDEFHLMLDEGRGFLLECLISKLRTLQKVNNPQNKQFQIIGMSATMSGLESLREWLDTEIYECSFRPVPLSEYIVNHGRLFSALDHSKMILDLSKESKYK